MPEVSYRRVPAPPHQLVTSMRLRLPLIIGFAIVLVVLVVSLTSHRRTQSREGFRLTRLDRETIRISWGTPSGVDISPRQTLEFFLGSQLENGGDFEFPQISPLADVWMFSVEPESLGSATPASFVNPLNDDAFDKMFELIRLSKRGNSASEAVTRRAAQHYTYLGWVVTNDQDARALKLALSDRTAVALDADITTPSGVLYRLVPDVEKTLASDPTDEAKLEAIRASVPVMYEVLNPKSGHPCEAMHVLYFDGHVERIPWGTFPATEVFTQCFPPPTLAE